MAFTPGQDKLIIIAGGGGLPHELVEACARSGKPAYVIGMAGEHGFDFSVQTGLELPFGHLGRVFSIAREIGASHVAFAGSVVSRPDLKDLKPDWATAKFIPKIASLFWGGDNTLLSGLMELIESQGLKMATVQEIAPHLLSGNGVLAGRKPGKEATANIALGVKAIKLLGTLDAGQAVVVERGRCVALEAAEGTAKMIERVGALRQSGQLSTKARHGVVVKGCKPAQDLRADLPAIGAETLEAVHRAGLAGVAVEAGRSLLLQREELQALAKELGVFVFGYDASIAKADAS